MNVRRCCANPDNSSIHCRHKLPAPSMRLSKMGARTTAIVETTKPALVPACDLMDRFHGLVQHRVSADRDRSIVNAMPSLLGSIAKAILQDPASVQAAVS